jgi:hypothetical protein
MKSHAVIWHIAAQIIEGNEAEGAAIECSNLMLDHGERDRQAEWLRVRTAIVILRDNSLGQPQ